MILSKVNLELEVLFYQIVWSVVLSYRYIHLFVNACTSGHISVTLFVIAVFLCPCKIVMPTHVLCDKVQCGFG